MFRGDYIMHHPEKYSPTYIQHCHSERSLVATLKPEFSYTFSPYSTPSSFWFLSGPFLRTFEVVNYILHLKLSGTSTTHSFLFLLPQENCVCLQLLLFFLILIWWVQKSIFPKSRQGLEGKVSENERKLPSRIRSWQDERMHVTVALKATFKSTKKVRARASI